MIDKDHPHACGDKYLALLVTLLFCGSSPRVWGQGFFDGDKEKKNRIIPTRVGTSLRTWHGIVIGWDHPHACGDK